MKKKSLIPLLLLLVAVACSSGGGNSGSSGSDSGSGGTTEPPIIINSGQPRLLFSDLISGPCLGNSDGAGGLSASEHGAIITIWGQQLGASQGTSRILINGQEAAHVYYWQNATGNQPGGPADLYSYHQMQEIAFSLPAGLSEGAAQIQVEVDGTRSNSLPFTLSCGRIFFVSASGSSSGDGSWQSPWPSVTYAADDARFDAGQAGPGDIIYVTGTFREDGGVPLQYSGSAEAPVALVGYPGSVSRFTGAYNNAVTLLNWYGRQGYWHFSKLTLDTPATGLSGFTDMRAVGLEITGPQAEGYGGSIGCSENANDPQTDGSCGGGTYYGLYIHDFGNDNTSEFHHTTYISNRDGRPNKAYEFGWCYLHDNKAVNGFHFYDHTPGGDWTGTMKIHDNVVVNQRGAGLGLLSGGTEISVPFAIYNNIFINCGQGPDIPRPGQSNYVISGHAVAFSEGVVTSPIRFYNNIIYGYGRADNDSGYGVAIRFGGSVAMHNNIIVDRNNRPYVSAQPTINSHNLFYNGGDGLPATLPDWASEALQDDPLFVAPQSGNFSLQDLSPALDSGTDGVSGLVTSGFGGLSRPQGNGYDLGAFERAE